MTEEKRLKKKCNDYAKQLVLLGVDDVVWEVESLSENVSSDGDHSNCPHWKEHDKCNFLMTLSKEIRSIIYSLTAGAIVGVLAGYFIAQCIVR